MTENAKLMVGYAAEKLDTQSVTQIVIAALSNVVGLALGAAVADGHFDERTAMILAEGVQVKVGDQSFWCSIFQHGDERVKHLGAAAVIAAAAECEAQAQRFEQRMPDGSAVWADPERSASVARHCAMYVRTMAPEKPYEILERLKKAEADAQTLREVSKHYAQMVICDPEAQNYVEAVMVRHDGAEFVLTIRRREGKTPAELKNELDARWRAAVERLLNLETMGSRRTMGERLKDLINEPDDRLSEDGIAARDTYREVQRLLKGE